MKRVLILLTILGLAAAPVMAKTQLEAAPVKKHAAAKHQALTRQQKKQQKKQVKKKLEKKQAKRAARKHKVAV